MCFDPREGSKAQSSCLISPEDINDRPDLREDENRNTLLRVLHDPFNLFDPKALLTLQGVCSVCLGSRNRLQLDPAVIAADCFQSEVDVGNA
jgi:hypothetical protein